MFRLSSSMRGIRTATASLFGTTATTSVARGAMPRRWASTTPVGSSSFKKFLPSLPSPLTSSTPLGQVWDGMYTNYRYRLAYVVLAWWVVLYNTFWFPYTPEKTKAAIRERDAYLESLKFSQP